VIVWRTALFAIFTPFLYEKSRSIVAIAVAAMAFATTGKKGSTHYAEDALAGCVVAKA